MRFMALLSKLVCTSIIMTAVLSYNANPVPAHPHVFVVQRIIFQFDDKGFAGFRMQWKFDEMFSSMIIEDYDKNKNNRLEPSEVKEIKEKAFSYISNFNYFSFVKINGEPFEVKYTKDFSARIDKHKLMYEFFIPCPVTATEAARNVSIATYDPSYYSAIYFAEKRSVALENSDNFHITTAVREDKSTSIYHGMVNPWAAFLDFRKK